MNKTKGKPSTGEGWAVHVYDSDRHLRFTLEPSHLWAFSWGIGVGILVAILWSALYSASHNLSSNTNDLRNLSPTPENSSREGSVQKSTSSFPFGID